MGDELVSLFPDLDRVFNVLGCAYSSLPLDFLMALNNSIILIIFQPVKNKEPFVNGKRPADARPSQRKHYRKKGQ